MSFDWQTEEDGDWDEQAWQKMPKTAVPSKRPWRFLLLIVVLLAIAGVVIYQQVDQRLESTTAAIEADIFASHNLLSRAAAAQDGPLGKTVLSGRDMGWSQTQTELVEAGLFYENPLFGLSLADEDSAFSPLFRENERFIDLTLDPDLNGAELVYARDYLAYTGDGLETVTLQHTAVYRRGETRWLLSPPLAQFWGDWQTFELDNITFVYPRRDETILLQLTNDLRLILQDACDALPELNCSADTPIRIRFDSDPESLLAAADFFHIYDGNLQLNLPTPTLVGKPINNAGYQALLHLYATKLIAALIGHAAEYECCQHAALVQAIVTHQLHELGLAYWPVTQETQASLAESGVHAELIFQYWSSTDFALMLDEDSEKLFGFVDFLLNQHVPHLTGFDLVSRMNDSRAYQSWLLGLVSENTGGAFGSLDLISRDWWFYALTQAEHTAVSNQPIPLPAQDLQIGCFSSTPLAEESETVLYRYNLAGDAWQKEFTYPGWAFFNPLPHDDGVVLQLIEVSEDQYWQTLLWRDGAATEVMNLEDSFSISLGQMDPNGRFLLSYFGSEEDEFLPQPLLIDMESCHSGACDRTTLGQTPYWSPDGQQMLLTSRHLFEDNQYVVDGRIITLNPEINNASATIWLQNVQAGPDEAVLVGEGSSPFWVTNERFGYIRTVPTAGRIQQELVLAATDGTDAEVVLETAVLQESLPETSGTNQLVMRYVIAHPTDENLLLLMAVTQSRAGYLFLINLDSREANLLFPINIDRDEHTLGFSPDGRFLAATASLHQEINPPSSNMPFGGLLIYDLHHNELQTILVNSDIFFPAFIFDWSSDGNWLAFIRDSNVIGLVAPAYDYQQTIIHEAGDCSSLAWINPVMVK